MTAGGVRSCTVEASDASSGWADASGGTSRAVRSTGPCSCVATSTASLCHRATVGCLWLAPANAAENMEGINKPERVAIIDEGADSERGERPDKRAEEGNEDRLGDGEAVVTISRAGYIKRYRIEYESRQGRDDEEGTRIETKE